MKIKDWGFGKMVAVLAGLGFVILTALTLLALFTLDFRGSSRKSTSDPWEDVMAKARAGDLTGIKTWAEAGDSRAEYLLGMAYFSGHGIPKDQAKGIIWFQKAAEQGYAQAQAYLGMNYYTGQGVSQNISEAFRWYTRAANQGNGFGQHLLGSYYEASEDPTNLVLAYKWHLLAIENGYEDSKWLLGDTKAKMTKVQIAEGERLVKEFVAVKEYVEVKK